MTMRRSLCALAASGVCAGAVTLGVVGVAGSASPAPAVNRPAAAQHVLKTSLGRFLTAPAQGALQRIATGSRQVAAQPASLGTPAIATGGGVPIAPSLTNVRVNNPAEDGNQVDQTTQSEPTIAVHGSSVAVGFNDSQQTPLNFEAGSSLTGYAYSTDGGASFTDGGSLPNEPEFNNEGDPWLASDRHGTMYFSNLAQDGFFGNLDIGVAKSTDGGKTWTPAAPVTRPGGNTLYVGDKDALAVGRDPVFASRDDLYVAWDDLSIDTAGNGFTGLPVARSTNGGTSWQVTYADKVPFSSTGCSASQYIGAQPIVDPTTGVLYVAAEKIVTNDPSCTGGTTTFSEVIFRSTDGGQTFGAGVKIADVVPSVPNGILGLAPGQYMRNLEFPTLAFFKRDLYVAWNDGALGGSHIRLARSTTNGATWSTKWVTSGTGDELQPALSADTALHLMYYQRNGNDTLDVLDGDSSDGNSFVTRRVTTQSSPGVFTVPQFDPVIAPAYMGDYISNVSDGTHPYFVWGDNRDTVTNFMWPHGRHDPNVYFAKG
jgi:hypothetical protein